MATLSFRPIALTASAGPDIVYDVDYLSQQELNEAFH